MSSRASYIPPSAETVVDFSDDDLHKSLSHTEPSAPPTSTSKPSKQRGKVKEKAVHNSSSSSSEKPRKKHTYRERERRATSPTPKSPTSMQSKTRQVFPYNFSEVQSEVGRKSPRPVRVSEVRTEERHPRHRRTMSTGTLKSPSTTPASSHAGNSTLGEDKTARRSSTAMYNIDKHQMSTSSASPSMISSASSSPSEATTTASGGSSGSNSTITQGFAVPGNSNRSDRPPDDRGRQPDGDITPRQGEFLPETSGQLNVFSFIDDASEVDSWHPSDSPGVAVENKSLVPVPQGRSNPKNGVSDVSRLSNKIDFPSQIRGRKGLSSNYWARREWLREQAEMPFRSDSGQSPSTTSPLRTPEHRASAIAHNPDPDGRGSPTGSTSSASDSTSGTVGDTDTTRSSSPERSPKGGGPKGESPRKTSARAAFEPLLLAKQRERAATTSAYPASSRSRQEPASKSDAPHGFASRSSPSGDVVGSLPTAQPNQRRTSSPATKRVSSSGSINSKHVQPPKSRELVSLPAAGNVAMKQKLFSAPPAAPPAPVNAPQARALREVSPERYYRASDAPTHISSEESSIRPYPHSLPPEAYFTLPHMTQLGYSPQTGPPSDYLPMPMMLSGAGMGMPPYMAPPSSIRPPSPHITDESKKSISGYELLASHLSSDCGGSGKTLVPLYRRFEALNHRVLLHLQDELSELEEELRKVDEADAQTRQAAASIGAGLPGPASRRAGAKLGGDLEWRRLDILGRVYTKTGQYNQALTSYSKLIKTLSPATKEDVKRYKSWLARHTPIAEPEARFVYEEADLLALSRNKPSVKPPPPAPPTTRWTFLLGDGYMLVLAGAILLPILGFGVIPGYLGRLAFVGMVAVAAVTLLGETKIACVIGGWEWGVGAAMYFAVMAIIAGIIS
ncbi:hypothetical protein FGG08_006789 [Glutinoglossum americanum]|uniref:DUF6594 domain-containing protein n=1 Tax=Glutinoglossum americanum TaxID=1670608 RepID=A0A9P8L008_9PEZI|nr:hypothetical protein FGG08_006789 [Glutinoglossum americanum]